VKTTNRDLVFVTTRQLRSPITVNLDSTIDLGQVVNTTEPVMVRGNEIRIGESASMDLNGAQYSLNHAPKAHRLTENQELFDLASLILMIIDNTHSVLDHAEFAHAGAVHFALEGVMPFRQSGSAGGFREVAEQIVGLGKGFTPSGDDLLGGFLATYNSFAEGIGRHKILLGFDSLEARTSWISAKLLDLMQRRVLDEQLSQLMDYAASGDTNSFLIAFESLLPRGHTSGIDILVGVLLALSLVRDVETHTAKTERLANSLGLHQ
jgi:hypothetical protein